MKQSMTSELMTSVSVSFSPSFLSLCVKDDMEGSGVGVANGVPGARGPDGRQVGVLCSWR